MIEDPNLKITINDPPKDTHVPGERWQFNADVANVFDDMLQRSVPEYLVMRDLVTSLGSNFVQRFTDIVDLGASRGEALMPFVRRFGAYNRHVAVEVSEPMKKALTDRFAGYFHSNTVTIYETDLRTDYPPVRSSLTMAILTLQFVPIECRQNLVQQVYDHLLPGGAFILVEKVLGANAMINNVMVARYYAMKRANGYTQEDIDRKRLSLEGVLVPMTAQWNEDLLAMAGFRSVDCFWRWMNFAGWLAVKGGRP